MKNAFVFEINMWRWLLGITLAATAIIAVFINRGRFVLPFVISLIAFYLLISEVYIPEYYCNFKFSVSGCTVTISKGVIVKRQIIIPLNGPLVFERVSAFPFSVVGVCFLVLRSRGVLVTLPLMNSEKVNKIVEATQNVEN